MNPIVTALDFETANSDPGSVCSVGLATLRGGEIIEREEILIRPPAGCDSFHYFNIAIHGIRPEMVRNAPEWDEVWPRIARRFEAGTVIAHNAPFDIGVFRRVMELYHLELPEFHFFCTCKTARRLWPEMENHKLNTLCSQLGFHFRHHQAGDDAAAAAYILLKMLETTGCANWEELLTHTRILPGVVSPSGCSPCRVIPGKRAR